MGGDCTVSYCKGLIVIVLGRQTHVIAPVASRGQSQPSQLFPHGRAILALECACQDIVVRSAEYPCIPTVQSMCV